MTNMPIDRIELWLAFGLIILIMLVIDLAVANRRARAISLKEASIWSIIWIGVSFAFGIGIYFVIGKDKALEFFTGYIVEESLSADNLFVFILIFSYFNIAQEYRPRILKWGIIGAIFMRGLFIFTGLKLLAAFHWIIYIFGAFLIFTSIKIALGKDEKIEPEHNPVVKLFKKFFPVTHRIEGKKFFIRENAVLYATPLFVALLLVETSDIIFALDSIPAIIAITRDPFIVYTSNIFAILGLRALFFVIAGMMELFRYLKTGVSAILCFVGFKMLFTDMYKIPTSLSLIVISGILAVSILASYIHTLIERRHR